jgi:hypothetical protein
MDETSREDFSMKYKYYSVYEYYDDEEKGEEGMRRIYTFDNEMAANDLVEFIFQNDFQIPNIGVEEEEHEIAT